MAWIVNHLEFSVFVHKADNGKYRIVGFEVEPFSILESEHKIDGNLTTMAKFRHHQIPMQPAVPNVKVVFSHNIRTIIDPNHAWVTRMDHYAKISSHYEAVFHEQLLLTGIIVFVLTSVVAQVIFWILRKDYRSLQELDKDKKVSTTNRFIRKLKGMGEPVPYEEVK